MAEINLNTRHILRSDTTSNWTTANPDILPGEIIYDKTTKELKINYNDANAKFGDLETYGLSKTSADGMYLKLTGGTLSGSLEVGGNITPTQAIVFNLGSENRLFGTGYIHTLYTATIEKLSSADELYIQGSSNTGIKLNSTSVLPLVNVTMDFGNQSYLWRSINTNSVMGNPNNTHGLLLYYKEGANPICIKDGCISPYYMSTSSTVQYTLGDSNSAWTSMYYGTQADTPKMKIEYNSNEEALEFIAL